MITRSQMRRQLRAQGGIMNTAPRKKFGIGSYFQKAKDKVFDRTRKLIPNELADVAVKAAPFVAPFYPGYAAIARGLGRFDQRGSISDALKQGALTYGFGKGIGKLGGASGSELGNVFGRQQYSMEGFKDKGLGRLFKGADAPKVDPKDVLNKNIETKPREGLKIVQKGVDFVKEKVPILENLPDDVAQKLLVGGITGGASALYSYFTGEFEPQEPGETMGEYLARRNTRVKQQMRGYMDSYYTPLRNPQYAAMSDEEKDKYIDSIVGQGMATGGRVGLANGDLVDPRMRNSLQENIRRNNAARAVNQMSRSFDFSNLSKYGINPKKYDSTPGPMRGIPAVKGMRDRIIQDIMNTQQPYSLTSQKPPEPRDSLTGMPESMMLPNMADGSMKSIAEMDAIRDRVLAAQQAQEEQYYLTDPISGKQYKSEQEAIDDLGIVVYNQRFASGGRVGLMGGTMPMGEPRVNQGGITELDYRAKGGFVPVGIKEKADDVPAMLSKNEFVFTADAVRGAGNGSIENGAQKMYDTMKNLERRVT